MKQLSLVLASVLFSAGLAFGHGDNDHVRGVVTAVTPQSITVQMQNKTSMTLAVTAQTVFEKSGATAHVGDLMVGDRVVVDVPKSEKAGTTREARLVRFGVAKKAAAAAEHHHPQ